MTRFSRLALLMVAVAGPIGLAIPAMAQSPAKDYLFQEQRFSRACRPPLKYAAGACVRRCPAGYEDMGRTCRQRSMRGGSAR
ncbi:MULTISPECIES: hypothetical protein [unclassified Methylobacterium]|uniref:hypothetical protein n=1 Tax=unclassified Methylobacterium TaxID=2615210 RepID=UPI0006F4FD2F|nr:MULTISPECIES: hypothetical protein [unclassified Methylobacterium]KQP73113.1 hypothetical protein ASF60_11390 [Methylobacterium sp. Leaf113]KQP91756.1 hypothetical protein ASF57_04350 [Methylobacterium sp. Leaf117]MCK2052653.1 hypothetical protein [Methylobacterium sp. 37f]